MVLTFLFQFYGTKTLITFSQALHERERSHQTVEIVGRALSARCNNACDNQCARHDCPCHECAFDCGKAHRVA